MFLSYFLQYRGNNLDKAFPYVAIVMDKLCYKYIHMLLNDQYLVIQVNNITFQLYYMLYIVAINIILVKVVM